MLKKIISVLFVSLFIFSCSLDSDNASGKDTNSSESRRVEPTEKPPKPEGDIIDLFGTNPFPEDSYSDLTDESILLFEDGIQIGGDLLLSCLLEK